MSKKWRISIDVAMVLIALIIAMTWPSPFRKTPTEMEEARLTKWVYDHSTLVSHAQCAEIVREVMKTKRPELMLAIIELESVKFTPGALSSEGAIGWCQVMYDDKRGNDVHGKELIKAGIIKEKRDLWDTGPNIRAGAFILEQKMKASKGDVAKALERYVGKKDGAYVMRILSNYANIKER